MINGWSMRRCPGGDVIKTPLADFFMQLFWECKVSNAITGIIVFIILLREKWSATADLSKRPTNKSSF